MIGINRLYEILLPDILKRLIEPVSCRISKFITSVVGETRPGAIVLDAGAGEGRHKALIKNRRYISIDTAWGDSSWDYGGLDAIAEINRLPFASNVFDCVLCIQVLEHVREPQCVLNEIFRTLKHGGLVCLSAPQGWGVHQPPHDYFRFTNFGLMYLFEKAGFEVIELKPVCGYFGYLANRLTVIPKTLFWQINNKLIRLALFPVEILFYFLFVLVLPIILNSMDFLDRKRDYTLNYLAVAKKP